VLKLTHNGCLPQKLHSVWLWTFWIKYLHCYLYRISRTISPCAQMDYPKFTRSKYTILSTWNPIIMVVDDVLVNLPDLMCPYFGNLFFFKPTVNFIFPMAWIIVQWFIRVNNWMVSIYTVDTGKACHWCITCCITGTCIQCWVIVWFHRFTMIICVAFTKGEHFNCSIIICVVWLYSVMMKKLIKIYINTSQKPLKFTNIIILHKCDITSAYLCNLKIVCFRFMALISFTSVHPTGWTLDCHAPYL